MTVKEVTLNDDSGLESTISEEKSFEGQIVEKKYAFEKTCFQDIRGQLRLLTGICTIQSITNESYCLSNTNISLDLDETIKEVLPEEQASSTNATSLSSSGQQDLGWC